MLKKYEKRKENIQYKEIKSPNYPFMFVEKQKMDKLKELTTAYRKKLRQKSTEDKKEYQEPKSGFIDFNRIYEEH